MAGHSRKQYLVVAGVLTLFTMLEIGVVYTGMARGLVIAALIGLAVSKALAVALYYMHLKHETKYLKMTVALPFAAPAVYALVLIAESAWRIIRW